MDRYSVKIVNDPYPRRPGVEKDDRGPLVMYEDAQFESAKFKAERDEALRCVHRLLDAFAPKTCTDRLPDLMGALTQIDSLLCGMKRDFEAVRTALAGERGLRSKCVGAIVTHPRDWAAERRDAWIYGCIVGWDDCLDGIAKKHGWSAENVALLRVLDDARRAVDAEQNRAANGGG